MCYLAPPRTHNRRQHDAQSLYWGSMVLFTRPSVYVEFMRKASLRDKTIACPNPPDHVVQAGDRFKSHLPFGRACCRQPRRSVRFLRLVQDNGLAQDKPRTSRNCSPEGHKVMPSADFLRCPSDRLKKYERNALQPDFPKVEHFGLARTEFIPPTWALLIWRKAGYFPRPLCAIGLTSSHSQEFR